MRARPIMKVSVPLDQGCPTERCILLRALRSLALHSKCRSDKRKLCYERRLEDTAWCVGWGNPRFAARRGLLRKRDGLRHDGWHGADDGRIHDGRWPLRLAVRRAVLVAAPGPAGRCGGVDLQPGPAQVDVRTLT